MPTLAPPPRLLYCYRRKPLTPVQPYKPSFVWSHLKRLLAENNLDPWVQGDVWPLSACSALLTRCFDQQAILVESAGTRAAAKPQLPPTITPA